MKNKFTFSKLDRLGIVAVILVFIVYVITLAVLRNSPLQPKVIIEYNIDSTLQKRNDSVKIDFQEKSNFSFQQEIKLSPFYPDSLSVKEWTELGFSKKQAEVIVNFRNASGGYKKPEDLKQVYVISHEKYTQLKPFMRFCDSDSITTSSTIDFNHAGLDDLIKVKGIGEVLANRILKYREKIGGLHSPKQLREVYGLEEEVCLKIEDQFNMNSIGLKTININDASKSELQALPYTNFEIIARIMKERNNHRLSNLDFLEETLLSPEKKSLLIPYLIFE